jgi:hypothetical protein
MIVVRDDIAARRPYMLKASLGFMFSYGFRTRSQPGHHIAIIDFVRARIDKKHASLLTVFDRLRRKRNLALYDDSGFVSHQESALKLLRLRQSPADQPLKTAVHPPNSTIPCKSLYASILGCYHSPCFARAAFSPLKSVPIASPHPPFLPSTLNFRPSTSPSQVLSLPPLPAIGNSQKIQLL